MSEEIKMVLDAIQGLQNDMQEMKAEVKVLQNDMQEMKAEVKVLQNDMQETKTSIGKINEKLDVLDLKQDRMKNKLEGLELDVKAGFYTMDKQIRRLQDSTETIEEILKMHEMA